MTWFIVRVELLNYPSGEDYTHLHARMRNAGFATSFLTDAGFRVELPPAMYFGEADATAVAIRQVAVNAVCQGLRAGLSYRLVVAKTDSLASQNLAVA